MFCCGKCGAPLEPNASFCSECGTKVVWQQPSQLQVPGIKCPMCGSNHVKFQAVSEAKGAGCLTILFYIILAVSVIGLIILIPLLLRKNTKTETYAVCQNCGHRWKHNNKTDYSQLWIALAVVAGILILGSLLSDPADADPTDPSSLTDAPTQPAVIGVSAGDLMQEYLENEVAADLKYDGQMIAVTGVVDSIGKDILDDVYITLETEDGIYSIQCYFSNNAEIEKVALLESGQKVTVIGKCTGLSITSVLVRNCEIE